MDGIAVLIRETYKSDSIGAQIPEEVKTEVLVSEKSLTRAEWRDAGQKGLNPSIVLTTARINYSGEKTIEYCGMRYGVYRTYHDAATDEIELYLEEKAGT